MARPKLYMETTVPSYLASWPSRDLVTAGHQQITKEWWDKRRKGFDVYVSQFVIDETRQGDPRAARERMKTVRGLPLLDIVPEVERVAAALLVSGAVPKRAATDAAHMAIAAVHGMDFLVTWNCVHIANAFVARAVAGVIGRQGFACPVICTPEELLGE